MNFVEAIKTAKTKRIKCYNVVFDIELCSLIEGDNLATYVLNGIWEPVPDELPIPKIDGSWASACRVMDRGYSVRLPYMLDPDFRLGCSPSGLVKWRDKENDWQSYVCKDARLFAHTNWEIYAREFAIPNACLKLPL
jgi:hypothetical protein